MHTQPPECADLHGTLQLQLIWTFLLFITQQSQSFCHLETATLRKVQQILQPFRPYKFVPCERSRHIRTYNCSNKIIFNNNISQTKCGVVILQLTGSRQKYSPFPLCTQWYKMVLITSEPVENEATTLIKRFEVTVFVQKRKWLATAASFHILSNLLFINPHIVRR
jgi:hypothetical protein